MSPIFNQNYHKSFKLEMNANITLLKYIKLAVRWQIWCKGFKSILEFDAFKPRFHPQE